MILTLISLVLLEVGAIIFFKILFIAVTVAIVLGISTNSYLFSLGSRKLSGKNVLRYYEHLMIIAMLGRTFVAFLCLSFVAWTVPFFSTIAWFSVRCAGIMPAFVIVAASAGFVGGVGLAIQILYQMANVRVISDNFIKSQRARFHTFNSRRYNYFYTLKWKAQQPIPAYCGEQFQMSREAVILYLEVIITNVTDALLLIKP